MTVADSSNTEMVTVLSNFNPMRGLGPGFWAHSLALLRHSDSKTVPFDALPFDALLLPNEGYKQSNTYKDSSSI